MTLLLALTLAGGIAAQDPAALLARIEALETRNRDLEARLEHLIADSEQSGRPAAPAAPGAIPEAAPFVPFPKDAWDLGYVGVHIGERASFNQDAYSSNFYTYRARRNEAGFIGLQFGRRWQTGSWVFGGEVSAAAAIGSNPSELFEVNPPFSSPDALYHHRRIASAAVNGELGWAINDTLVYSKIGIEAALLRTTILQGEKITNTDNVAAPFVGIGLAQRLDSNWSLELEGRYGYSQQGLSRNDFAVALRVNYLVP